MVPAKFPKFVPRLSAPLIFLLLPTISFAQSASLALSSGTAPTNGSVSLNLTLGGGAQPAGLQWTFSYATADFTSMTIALGASASGASKSLSCFGVNGSYTCLLTGINSTTMSNGVVATATMTLSASLTASRAVQVTNTMAAALSSNLIASTGTGGIVTLPGPVPDTQPPTAPGSLSASAMSGTQINLAWTASTDNVGVTGYRVERCQAAGCSNFAQIASLSGTTTSYNNTGLTANTSYSYRVRATDAAANFSGYSSTATASTAADTQAPTAPTSLTANPASGSQINLSWTASTDNIGVTGYRVDRCQGAGCTTFAQIATPATATFNDTGLTVNTSYSYRVRATDAAANLSGYSNTATASTLPTVSSGVLSYALSEGTGTALADLSGNGHTGTITTGITWTTLGKYGNALSFSGATGQQVTVTNPSTLNFGTSDFTISAWIKRSALGGGQRHILSKCTTAWASGCKEFYFGPDNTLRFGSYATSDLNGPAISDTNWHYVTVTFVDSTNQIRLYIDGVNTTTGTKALEADNASHVVHLGNLHSNNPFAGLIDEVRVYAAALSLAEIQADMNTPIGPATPDTTAPTVPSNLSAAPISQNQINLGWTASSDNVGVTGYNVEGCQGAGCTAFAQIGSATGVTYSAVGLAAGTSYSYRIRALDQAGNLSGYSAVASATTTSPVPVSISGLSCTPATLNAPGTVSCAITLTGAASAGGAVVAVSDDNANLTVPSSVTVAAGAATGSFTATAGTITTDQTAVITATYGGATRTSSISLVSPPAQVSALSCTPASLGSSQATTCIVTLTKGAPVGGAVVTVSDDNANLTVPASVTVAPAATTGSFTATAGTISTDQPATITASLTGGSKSATVNLIAAATVLSIWSSTSTPAVSDASDTAGIEVGLKFRSTVAGYVTGVRFYKGSQNTGTHTGSLWSNSGSLLARATFTNESASGWQQALFPTAVSINANTTYVISYRAPKGRYSLNTGYFAASGVTNGTLRALKDGEDGGNGVYRYSNTSRFPNATSQSSNYWVDLVFTTQQPALLSDATSGSDLPPANLSGESDVSGQTVAGDDLPAPTLSCSPRIVQAGGSFTCALRLDEDRYAKTGVIAVAASGTDARLPAHIMVRAGQRIVIFHGLIDKAASQSLVLITTGEGEGHAQDQIAVLPAGVPVFSLPDVLYVRPGDPIAFTVAARDGGDLPVTIAASNLPLHATFEESAKRFAWAPLSNQEGNYTLTFTAINTVGASSIGQTRIVVASGRPQVMETAGLSCTPGSIATLQGRWLSLDDQLLFDRTGSSLALGGTTVRANGSLAPILSVSRTRVDFLCPSNQDGREINLVLETAMGASGPLRMATTEAKPVLLSVDESETEGTVTMAGTDRLTVVRDVRGAGEPAQLGDLVVVRATGLGVLASEAASMAVKIRNIEAQVESVSPDPAAAGVFQIFVRIPVEAGSGDAIPVQLIVRSSLGQLLASNTVTMAIE